VSSLGHRVDKITPETRCVIVDLLRGIAPIKSHRQKQADPTEWPQKGTEGAKKDPWFYAKTRRVPLCCEFL
jgi:hypothetical protein